MTDDDSRFDLVGAAATPRALGLLLPALWFGLFGGLGQSAVAAVSRYQLGRYTHLSRDIVWTAPVSETCLLLLLAALLSRPARRSDRWWYAAMALFASLSALGVLLFVARLHPLARLLLAGGIGLETAHLVRRHHARFSRVIRLGVPVLASVVLLVGVGLRSSIAYREQRTLAHLTPARAGAPNILLLILDTVRSLDLSLYGYGRETSPELSRLGARGVVFERAIAPSSWTLPSHASMFTGRAAAELSTGWRRPLDRRYPTLAETLRDNGYRTAGFVGNLEYTTTESGLQRGFAHYEGGIITPRTLLLAGAVPAAIAKSSVVRHLLDWHQPINRKSAETIRENLVDWLGDDPPQPWFVFANFYDAHNPYLPDAPFDTAFTGRRLASSERNFELDNPDSLSPAAAQGERDAYDQAIRWLDHEIGALLRDLEARGELRNTIIVVTSDHGEQFGDHGLLSHGNSLYLPSLHVPLVIAMDGQVPAGRRVTATVSLQDLAATILDLAGQPAALPGRSLRALWTGERPAGTAPAVASVRYASGQPAWYPIARGDMATALDDARQLVRDGTGAEEFFDLVRDPTGATPLAAEPETIVRLRAALPVIR